MIYAARFFFALLLVLAVSAIVRFPLQKRENSEFVGQIANRAASGRK